MTQQQKKTALAVAIVAGLVSLPMTWLSISGAQFDGSLGEMATAALGDITFNANAFNGRITFLVETPIWFIVAVAIAASVLQLMENSPAFSIPPLAQWLTAIVGVVWIGLAVVLPVFAENATLGIGALVGLVAAVIPLVCLSRATSNEETPQLESQDESPDESDA